MVTLSAPARRPGVKAERGASKVESGRSMFAGQMPSGSFAQVRPVLMRVVGQSSPSPPRDLPKGIAMSGSTSAHTGKSEHSLTESRNRVDRLSGINNLGLGLRTLLESAGVYSSDAAQVAETRTCSYRAG